MTPHVIGGLVTVALALIGATMVVWPNWWTWFAQLGMYRERPEPSDLYLLSIRLSGVILVIGGAILATFLFTWQPATREPDTVSPEQQERIDELQHDSELVAQCLELRPVFEDAIVVDDSGAVTNVEELESLAAENGATIRPMGDPVTTAVIVKIDGASLFAVPTPEGADHCTDLRLRLLAP